jgi:NADP-dependent 3-hydroxy acid dehydrogenase YdfG
MSAELNGRKVLVTGGASGIGAACAAAFAAAGAAVTVADLNERGARAVAEPLGGTAVGVDLADRAFDAAALAGGMDVIVNNAGIQHVAPVEDFPEEKFRLIIALMLEAPFRLVRAALPHMYAEGWGRIVNISSVHGLRASPFKSAYVAAKHGLEGLSPSPRSSASSSPRRWRTWPSSCAARRCPSRMARRSPSTAAGRQGSQRVTQTRPGSNSSTWVSRMLLPEGSRNDVSIP